MDDNLKSKLFIDGINLFNDKKFYEAHESWEELWTEFNLDDALLIQGLIQLSVAYFHITNINLKGSKNLFNKSLPKLEKFKIKNNRNINVQEIINTAEIALQKVISIKNINDFDWNMVPKIKIDK
ncbi:MAG: hypothetical protein CMG54_03935 [Candidatus Marinimicrobia bacterium]|nr:hypothetical protein [Candidatus Neomarinimicrobiota bacterium]|tara:strand:+ start:7 stop:381 length:375 start_codon:yes stop_codon:yes gene_type:complete